MTREAQKLSAIERAIAFIAPGVALRRARSRLALDLVRSYQAAGGGRRTQNLLGRGTSANAEISPALSKLRDRHRELRRNNPWVKSAIEVIAGETVGYGIAAGITARKRQDEIVEAWRAFADTTACDAEGLHNLGGLQGTWMEAIAESGEVLVRRRRRLARDGLPVPLQLQTLEADHLDHGKTTDLPNGGRILQGVEFDPIGRRVAYWLYPDHPGEVLGAQSTSVRVPASEVAHIFWQERPGQVRGVPWGRSAYLTVLDFDEFEDAYLFRQKLANCLTAFVYDYQPDLNGGGASAALPLPEQLEPGLIAGLPAGKDIKFSTPPTSEGYAPYAEHIPYRIAAAYGISYEALTGNLSKVSFTSGRMGWLRMGQNVERWRWRMLIPQGCEVIAQWFLEALRDARGIDTTGVAFTWTPPRRPMLAPQLELPALKEGVRSGLISMPEAHRELGYDTETVLDEIAATNQMIDERDLVLDSDPRKVSISGLAQTTSTGSSPTDDVSSS